ncbi:MAG: AAA family ATPase, partial [Bifidobacterium adolescentis]
MSNDFDDATQLGSIGHNPNVPSQPGQQQPAFHTPNLPEQPQADEDPEGTLLSAHGTAQPALPQQ